MMTPRILVGLAVAATLAAAMPLACNGQPAPKASSQTASSRAASSQATTEPSGPELAFEVRRAEAFYTGDQTGPAIDLQIYGADRGIHAWVRMPKELKGPISQKIDPAAKPDGVWLVSGPVWRADFYQGGVMPLPDSRLQKERATEGLVEGQAEVVGRAPEWGRAVITLRNLRFPSGVIRQIGPIEVPIGYYAP